MNKIIWKICEVFGGIIFVYIGVVNFAGLSSAQAVGASIVNIIEIGIGVYFFYSVIKNK